MDTSNATEKMLVSSPTILLTASYPIPNGISCITTAETRGHIVPSNSYTDTSAYECSDPVYRLTLDRPGAHTFSLMTATVKMERLARMVDFELGLLCVFVEKVGQLMVIDVALYSGTDVHCRQLRMFPSPPFLNWLNWQLDIGYC
jgi:hypothetical protein